MDDYTPRELWMLRAIPADPGKRPFVVGEGSMLHWTKAEAERAATDALKMLGRNGDVQSVECVRVTL